MPILVAADFDDAEWAVWRPCLEAALPDEHLVRDRSGFEPSLIDAALVANPPPGSLAGLPRLGLIQSLWAGVDRLLDDPTVPAAVPLARMVDPAMNRSMAETALWAVLSLHRGFFGYAADQRAGRWRPRMPCRADEFQVCVLGLGEMGRTSANALARQGYRVAGWQRTARAHADLDPRVETAAGDDGLSRLMAQAHVIVNLLPLTSMTRGLFNAARWASCRRGVSLVNLARGAHVVEPDLLAALDDGQVGHAVLDVFATEPLPADHAYWRHPGVSVLPHVAAPTDPRSAAVIAACNLQAWRRGAPVEHLVDRQRGY